MRRDLRKPAIANARRRRRDGRRCRSQNVRACVDRRVARAGAPRRSAPDRARSARRPCASRARRPSAAGFRRDTTCPGRNAGSRSARSACAGGGSDRRRGARLVGPTAAVFHSAASKSSIETKVGSPPMVRRTSCVDEIAVDRFAERVELRPGFVGERPGDARRFVDARRPHVEAEFALGAALDGAGRSARRSDNAASPNSGIWPSPQNRPEVASRPIQPAPGR